MTNDRFREAIEFHFDDIDVKSKEHLGALMRKRKFFNASNPEKRLVQEQKLLDDAWKHLKEIKESPMMTARGREGVTMSDVGRKSLIMRDSKTGRIIKWIKKG